MAYHGSSLSPQESAARFQPRGLHSMTEVPIEPAGVAALVVARRGRGARAGAIADQGGARGVHGRVCLRGRVVRAQ